MKKELLENLVKTTLDGLSVSCECAIKEVEDGVMIEINGQELNHLIGYRGETLNALTHFLNIAYYNKSGEYVRIVVDINGYRSKRKDKLEGMTKSFIDRVRFFGKDVEMPPMSSSERKIVHTFVSNYDDVVSESVGEGDNRRVVIKPKRTDNTVKESVEVDE